jgi:hypothetical protein
LLETVGIPNKTHLGVYLFSTASLVIPLSNKISLIPNLETECPPEFARWGCIKIFAIDFAVSQKVGLGQSFMGLSPNALL